MTIKISKDFNNGMVISNQKRKTESSYARVRKGCTVSCAWINTGKRLERAINGAEREFNKQR